MSSTDDKTPLLSPDANAEREKRIDYLIVELKRARDALATGSDMEHWAAELVDRLWETAEEGRRPTLEALALMDAFEHTPEQLALPEFQPPRSLGVAGGVLSHLRGWGYLLLVEKLQNRTDEITRAWEAWRNKKRGAKSGAKRVSKWIAVERLTGMKAETAKDLWKKRRKGG